MDNLNNNSSNCTKERRSSSISHNHAEMQHNQLHHTQHSSNQTKMISPNRQRAMSFLYCISKRLGRRVQHELVYNSQDDLRSSSTDSFSLSLDRGSSSEKHIRSSSIDLSSDGHSSRASSSSGCSRLSSNAGDENDEQQRPLQQQLRHSYETHCYHVIDDEDDESHDDELTKCTVTATNSTRTPLKGLNLNRISISSVSRVLQHISSSSSSSTSMRSLSCNSTPLKRTTMSESKKSSAEKKSADNSAANSTTKSKSKSSKPQLQQQRILRQPTSYVYLKGMSGLPTRRVPRSSVCCSYACR